MRQAGLDSLRELGFSDLESRVYFALLERGPQTGYRLAKTIAKAGSNTYTALEALEQQGFVLGEGGSPRIYHAIPIASMLDMMQRRFQRRREQADRHLRSLAPRTDDDAIYRLVDADLVLNRCTQLLDRARSVVLIDAFPRALDAIAPAVEAAAARGVDILAKVYTSAGVDLIPNAMLHSEGADVISKANGDWITCTGDAQEAVVALLGDGMRRVRYAIAVHGPHATAGIQSGVACEIAWAALTRCADERGDEPVARAVERLSDLIFSRARGYRVPAANLSTRRGRRRASR